MGDDDRTVMMSGFSEEADPDNEATVMASAFTEGGDQDDVATRMISAFDEDAQEAATVMVSAQDSSAVAAAVAAADARYSARGGAPSRSQGRADAQAPGGGFLAILGGLGPWLALAGIVFLLIPQLQGMRDQLWAYKVSPPVTLAAHLFVALGLLGARRRSSVAWVLAALAHIAVVAAVAMIYVGRPDVELVFFLILAPPSAWAISGLWVLFAGPGLGRGRLFLGLALLLGGGTIAAAWVLQAQGDFFKRGVQDDTFIAMMLGGMGLLVLGLIPLSIKFFGRLR